MTPIAFTTIHPIIKYKINHSNTKRYSPSCTLDPSRPIEPNRDLSATDRNYLSKVRARILNAKRKTAAKNNGEYVEINENNETVPILPDDLDKMEDLIYDRGPENIGQAKIFGAWLDESVAGRKAIDPNIKPEMSSENDNFMLADELFTKAINIFGRGMYIEATELFRKASNLVGAKSRLGGQYQLWQAQALDASGNKKEATKLFSVLSTHTDPEIRKVSRELLFIITAPKLQLDKNSFVEIPDIDQYKSPSLSSSLLNLSDFSTLRTSLIEKPPEPHSLEWYMDKERPQKIEDHSSIHALAIIVAIIGTLAFMASSPPM